MLARFLDAVDRRDGAAAAALFAPQGSWSTASDFGELQGREAIRELVGDRLPPNGVAGNLNVPQTRHRFVDPARGMEVTAPNGSQSQFTLTVDESGKLIQRLERKVLRGKEEDQD